MKTITIEITYKFKVKYEHIEHLKHLKEQLKEEPEYDLTGTAIASDNEMYSYSCKRIGKGKIVNTYV